LKKSPANGHVVLPAMARFVFAGTRRVHFGTGGHSRARATTRDTAQALVDGLDRGQQLAKVPATVRFGVAHAGAKASTSFAREMTCSETPSAQAW